MKIRIIAAQEVAPQNEVVLLSKNTQTISHPLYNSAYAKHDLGHIFFAQDDTQQVLFVGLGAATHMEQSDISSLAYMQECPQPVISPRAMRALHSACEKYNWTTFQVWIPDVALIPLFVQEISKFNWQLADFKTKPPFVLKEVLIITHPENLAQAEQHLFQAQVISKAVQDTRYLSALPANVCTTTYLKEKAMQMISQFHQCDIKVIDAHQMKALGMRCHLAVGQAAQQESSVVCLEYRGASATQPPLVLTGKGLTYDTGGLSLKKTKDMVDMNYDMAGAAAVLTIIEALATLEVRINVVGIMALAENAIDSKSYRPGDIIKSMQGMYVEVGDTDAEGRLVLCDTLHYAQTQYQPHTIINLATLTGCAIDSLGMAITPIFSTDLELTHKLLDIAKETGEKFWPMPFYADYASMLDSNTADICNITSQKHYAGSITAALFLKKFVQPGCAFVHLDIARFGPEGEKALGRNHVGVATLIHYLSILGT
jgi:leucyl aminopeptidase